MLNLAENATALEKLVYGLKVTALGMGTVFAVLLFLWLVLMLLQLFYKKKNVSENADDTKNIVPTPPVVSLQNAIEIEEDESELVAVIMAAVYAASGAIPGTLRMISYKKRPKTPWNRK